MTTLSSASSLVAASTSTASAAKTLVKMADGEYTAASVTADPTDATKLGLVKEKDGNYGTGQASASSTLSTTSSVAARASSAVRSALTELRLGGS